MYNFTVFGEKPRSSSVSIIRWRRESSVVLLVEETRRTYSAIVIQNPAEIPIFPEKRILTGRVARLPRLVSSLDYALTPQAPPRSGLVQCSIAIRDV